MTRGDAGGTGGARVAPGVAAARAVPCNTATVSLEGPTGRPHGRAGDTGTAMGGTGGAHPGYPRGAATPTPHLRTRQASPDPSPPIPSAPKALPNITLRGN